MIHMENTLGRQESLRGQAAIENLIMVGFALAFIVPLAFLFLSSTGTQSSKTTVQQAQVSAGTIADTAGEIFLQGAGAKESITVNYPDGVVNTSASNGAVVISLLTDERRIDIVGTTFANLSADPSFSGPKGQGLQRITLVNRGNYVEVSYG